MAARIRWTDMALWAGLGLAASGCAAGSDRLGGAALPQETTPPQAASEADAAAPPDDATGSYAAADPPPEVIAAAPAKAEPPVDGGSAPAAATPGDPLVVRSGPMLEVTTRGHFATGARLGGALTPTQDRYSYGTNGAIPGLATAGGPCPADLAIVVHGAGSSAAAAQEQFKRARAALKLNGYHGLAVGFSWDADTTAGDGRTGGDGRANAESNGPKLAEFVDDFRYACRAAKLHVVAYDLGALAALEAVRALRTNDGGRHGYYWNGPLAGAVIDDVHLLGAAVGDESPWQSGRFGLAIATEVGRLVNYHSAGDEVLASSGAGYTPGGEALGLDGVAVGIDPFDVRRRPPANYADVDVEADLVGGASRHASYFGWPAKAGQSLASAGAMSRVRANFR